MAKKICVAKGGCGEGERQAAFKRKRRADNPPQEANAPAGLKLCAAAMQCLGHA
ncbi:MAG: hypothetical protein LBU32_33145 [Clostridiales bacterium]|jgi:hypothetical protein|nr:hypothetical protein [Clostridiales bacterium]